VKKLEKVSKNRRFMNKSLSHCRSKKQKQAWREVVYAQKSRDLDHAPIRITSQSGTLLKNLFSSSPEMSVPSPVMSQRDFYSFQQPKCEFRGRFIISSKVYTAEIAE